MCINWILLLKRFYKSQAFNTITNNYIKRGKEEETYYPNNSNSKYNGDKDTIYCILFLYNP